MEGQSRPEIRVMVDGAVIGQGKNSLQGTIGKDTVKGIAKGVHENIAQGAR